MRGRQGACASVGARMPTTAAYSAAWRPSLRTPCSISSPSSCSSCTPTELRPTYSAQLLIQGTIPHPHAASVAHSCTLHRQQAFPQEQAGRLLDPSRQGGSLIRRGSHPWGIYFLAAALFCGAAGAPPFFFSSCGLALRSREGRPLASFFSSFFSPAGAGLAGAGACAAGHGKRRAHACRHVWQGDRMA